MAVRAREEDRQRLVLQVTEWNANRLDLFELSLPDEYLEFHGVMRFFYQDTGAKVATKCIRVASSASTKDVLATLIEKFRPDMRMLSAPNYALYEVHVNGDERKLQDHERPLFVQLNWGKDDREGRFLLKREDDKTANLGGSTFSPQQQQPANIADQPVPFKRKLSKREKKELKKKEKEAKLRGKENVAEKLYNEVPETSFTRSISNPEAVMRRRRQMKLEKKLQQFRSKDGGPDTGGTLKIYGDKLRDDVPYKTLLLSTSDSAAHVVRETLEKYGMEKENPADYCLVQVHKDVQVTNEREYHGENWGRGREYILDDDDCPLAILMQHMQDSEAKGTIMFQLQKRSGSPSEKRKKKKGASTGRLDRPDDFGYPLYDVDRLPYLLELNQDGSVAYKAKKHRLPQNVTEVGAEKGTYPNTQFLQLYGPDIHPRHCVIAHTEGIVTVTPTQREAEVYIGGQRVFETTMLQPGMLVRFGRTNLFRFCDPAMEEKQLGHPGQTVAKRGPPSPYDQKPGGDPTNNFETTFDVDGHVETVASPGQGPEGMQPHPMAQGDGRHGTPNYGEPQDILPSTLEFHEEGEDVFLTAMITEVNGASVQFKLAPTYTLYMAVRYRISNLYRPDMGPQERAQRLTMLTNKVANLVQQAIQESRDSAAALSFWMANASELLHFYKQDVDVSRFSVEAQDLLAEAVQLAFRYLVHCMQAELRNNMVAFLQDTDDDLEDDGDVLQVLSSAMSLLRRCRVNAALTIQLFSQLFHFVNMWLFNKLVLEPRLQLCTRAWGHRLKRRLARVEIWAEKQGLELAADCHLARIIQAAHLLQAPKSSPDDLSSISSTCFKLNSLQLRALLEHYVPGPGEPRIPPDLINSVVAVAENTADELTRSDGREVRLEEEPDLQLPFLLPEDGYSCDIVRGVPNGLGEFLEPLSRAGLCRMTVQPMSSGMWTIYMTGADSDPGYANLRGGGPGAPVGPGGDAAQQGLPKEPEVSTISFAKVSGSMGLSIVAAKGEGQEKRGIYIKSVVTGGAADLDGRLQAGDQLLEVDGKSLVGLTQEKAAELMTRTGHTVTLKVAKQGAIYHGLATLLSQPSPVMQRASPRRSAGAGGKMQRPKSEEVSRFEGSKDSPPSGMPGRGHSQDYLGPPLNQQMAARSSPALRESEESKESPGEVIEEVRVKPVKQLALEAEARDRLADAQNSTFLRRSHHGARSHEQLRDADPYATYGQRGPPSAPYYSPHEQQQRELQQRQQQQREQAMRSKSTSNLDHAEPHQDYRQIQSTSTLPRNYHQPSSQPHPQHQPQAQPQPQPQPGGHARQFASQPDLHRPHDARQPDDFRNNYENYPQQQQHQQRPPGPYGQQQPNYMNQNELRNYPNQYPQANQDVRTTMSMSNIRDDPSRSDMSRTKSEEFNRVQEWQKRNEMSQSREQWAGQARPSPGPGPGPGPGYGQTPPGYPPSDAGSSRVPDNEVPRSQANNQQQQQNFYFNTQPRQRDATPPFQQLGRPAEPEHRPNIVPKPNVAPKPTVKPQEVPRVHVDNRKTQPGFFDPRQQQQEIPPGGRPYMGPGHPPQSQAGYSPSPQPAPYQMVTTNDLRPAVHSSRQDFQRDKHSPAGRLDQYGRRIESPELPPPPDLPPPPEDMQGAPEELPPPPPPPNEYERQIQEEQDRMLRRMQGLDIRNHAPAGSDPRSQYPGQFPGGQQKQPQPQVPGPQQKPSPDSHHNYQNLPPAGSRPHFNQSPRPQGQYPYQPRSGPPTSQSPLATTPTRPPIATKPRVLNSSESSISVTSSAWEKAEKEQEEKRREEETRRFRDMQIAELEVKPHLTPEESERLRRLRLDQEFQRRVEEASSREDDEGGDSDTDLTDRAAGRAKMLRMLQEDMEKKRQQIAEDRQNRKMEDSQADREMAEKQERRIQMFEQERMEQKERIMKRLEKREKETEEYLRQQREIRERQRREQEEHQKIQRLEEEKLREKQREEVRRKKEMEREQLREMQVAREAEERAMKEAQERAAREAQMKEIKMKEDYMRAMEAYGYNPQDPMYRPGQQPHQMPPHSQYNSYPSATPAPVQSGPQDPRGLYAPPPPERRSSYEVANQHTHRPGSQPTLNNGHDPSQQGQPRPGSSPAVRQGPIDTTPAKKSVSFHSNLATEIQDERHFPSESSEGSYAPYGTAQPPTSQSGGQYPYHSSSSTGSSMSEQPQYFQRGSYGPPTPMTPGANEVFQEHRTPENAYNAQLVAGPTPGVVGAQEVYRDPRDRIAARRAQTTGPPGSIPERMSFRDKMKMFASEAGENTPKDRPKISRAQRAIETSINGGHNH